VQTSALAAPYECDGQGEGEALIQNSLSCSVHMQQIQLQGREEQARYNWNEQKWRNDGQQVQEVHQQCHLSSLSGYGGHATQTRPIKGGQQPRMQQEGVANEVVICRLCIYPGLPNATSVQQETDINYCPFKSIVCDNLKRIASAL
jgi:hypothetical protein